ncbi:MAG: peptide chain release factor N(5)-glutamine methyltransferase [Candidatus Hydrogenedentes bacterium]|nr:peptide chain release factor N(5)-glutamine methyltransferase [Candidatus Hydrogenedentota bacterium]
MTTVQDRIEEAAQVLAEVSDTPRADAEFLMAHLLNVPRAKLPLCFNDAFDTPEFQIFVERRLACEPVPYILGEWEFFSLPLKTRAPVLVPRPETEHLVEVVLHWAQNNTAPNILDLCTGSGCVALALAMNLRHACVTATDISDDALALANENINLHNLDQRVTIRKGDLFDAIGPAQQRFDVICANPPYVEDGEFPGLSPTIRLYEDPRALVAGGDGLDIVRRIVEVAPQYLAEDGLLALEMGERQYDAVAALMQAAGFRDVSAQDDLAGIRRIAYTTKGK